MIYLDNNATTRPADEVIEAMLPFLTEFYGNPSSAYEFSRAAKAAVGKARESVGCLLGANDPSEILFTSGGTESDNWAIRGALESVSGRTHVITTRVEHEAVRFLCEKLQTGGAEVSWIDVDADGMLDIRQITEALRKDTAVVSVMMANNETGVLFPVAEIAEAVKERSDALVHVDGVNAAGKIPIDLKNTGIDLFSISGHKFHGPKGVGALYVRKGVELASFAIGGGQENGRRAGTEAVHQIAGIGAAADLVGDLAKMEKIRELRDEFESRILNRIPDSVLNGHKRRRLPNTSNISFPNVNGEAVLAGLNDAGICVSTGSACNEETKTASPVLKAMDIPFSRAMGAIRFSLGRYNNEKDLEFTAEQVEKIVGRLIAMRP